MKTLKQLGIVLFLIFACITLNSCGSNDSGDEPQSNYYKLIVGTWAEEGYDPNDFNKWVYHSNGTGYKDFNWSDGKYYHGDFIWTILEGNTLQRIMLDEYTIETYTIDKLSSSTLVLDGRKFVKVK